MTLSHLKGRWRGTVLLDSTIQSKTNLIFITSGDGLIQVLGLRDWIDADGKKKKREVFFNKGWRFEKVADVFNTDALTAVLDTVPDAEKVNLYFTVADCFEESGRKLREQWAIPFDIDGLDLKFGEEKEQAWKAVTAASVALGISPNDMPSVFTGNGVQFFIGLTQPIVDEDFFDKARIQYATIAKRIQSKLVELGIKGTVDTSVWSKGRLMRLPNTLNRKEGKPERMSVILNGRMVTHNYDLYEQSGIAYVEQAETLSDVALKNYPKPDANAVCTGCKFIQHCKERANDIQEPAWYAMLSVVARLDEGRDIAHDISSKHSGYSHYETDNKIEQALAASGPRTCKNIETLWNGCQDCEHYGKVTSPIMLKGDNYIGSKDFGYRHRKIEGNVIVAGAPVYTDLIKQFNVDYQYKVVKDNIQVVIYNGKHWEYITDTELKAWCTKLVKHEPSSREMSEFVAQLKAYNVTSIEDLHTSKDGFLNFSNCVLNVRTRETTTHSPEYGFFEVLPFAYDPRAKAPQWEKFLLDVMDGDEEKADTLKEFAGYAISGDPCWLQKALLLVGDGSNGKSIYMEILGELVGKGNYGAVAMQELEKDTMRHYLVNKLFNYSEETSIRALSDSSTFKLLVSGGMVTVKQLYVQPYIMANRAKIILSANNMPYSRDNSYGLLRRLAIIHFDVVFKVGDGKHDPRMKDKLREEFSGICNSILDAYAKLKERGDLSAAAKIAKAVEKYAEENDPILYFMGTEIELTNDAADVSRTADIYAQYVGMCEAGNFGKPLSVVQFGKKFGKASGISSTLVKKNGDVYRALIGVKLRKDF